MCLEGDGGLVNIIYIYYLLSAQCSNYRIECRNNHPSVSSDS